MTVSLEILIGNSILLSSESWRARTSPRTGTRMHRRGRRPAAGRGGPDAVSTRAVSAAAGVQLLTIYRLFGDKEGLLDAVVADGFTAYLTSKTARKPPMTRSRTFEPAGICT